MQITSTDEAAPGAHPYRPIPTFDFDIGPTTMVTRPSRPLEVLAALGLETVADVALWNGGSFGPGGYGMAAFFALTPLLLLVAVRSARFNTRLGVIGSMLALVALRCAFAPTTTSVLSGVVLVFAFTVAMRGRRVSFPELVRWARHG